LKREETRIERERWKQEAVEFSKEFREFAAYPD
jgi:hypothetical protein